MHKKIIFLGVLVTVILLISIFIIINSIVNEMKDKNNYLDRVEYGFNITTDSPEVQYLLKFPIPSNWELENYVVSSEGNPSIYRTTEVIIRERFYYGPTPETTDYIVINGSGNSKMTFAMKKNEIRGINFPEQDFSNNTMSIFALVHTTNESISYHFWFEEYLSSSGPFSTNIGHDAEYSSKGTIDENGWQKVKMDIIMS